MVRIIAIASGKGGTGKTTLTANLGIALAEQGFKVLLVDADIAMANLSLLLGMQGSPITLHDVLLGESSVHDCIYEGPKGVELLPSGLSLESYRRIDSTRLKSVIDSVKESYDFVLLDVAAGIERITLSALSASEEVLLITEPNPSSIADALKAKISAQKLNNKVMGIVLNKVFNEPGEISGDNVMRMLELPLLGTIPFDENVRRSFYQERKTVITANPNSAASKEIYKIASRLTGKTVETKTSTGAGKPSFIKSLFEKLFKRK